MLSIDLYFKIAFASYKKRKNNHDYAHSLKEWNKVEKVGKFIEVFYRATHVTSGSL